MSNVSEKKEFSPAVAIVIVLVFFILILSVGAWLIGI
jgi:hypothetical protein